MNDDHATPGENGVGRPGISRRSFVQTLGLSAAAGAISAPDQSAGAQVEEDLIVGPDPVGVTLRINGQDHQARLDPATTLLDALRIELGLTGSKEVCDRGACGACTVLVDGRPTVSCMMLALDAAGSEITTIEGLAPGDQLDPVQESFIRHDALQCGYCTSGLVVAARSLLDDNPKPTLPQIKRALSGNICRCGTYTNIFNAVLEASGQPVIEDQGRPLT